MRYQSKNIKKQKQVSFIVTGRAYILLFSIANKIKMNKLLNLVKGVSLNAETEAILSAHADNLHYDAACSRFFYMPTVKRSEYLRVLGDRLKVLKKPAGIVCGLHLIERLSRIDHFASLPQINFINDKTDKESISLVNFAKFYCFIIKNNQCIRRKSSQNCEMHLKFEEELNRCEFIIANVAQLLRVDFILNFCLNSSKKALIQLISKDLLMNMKVEMDFANEFIKLNLPLVLKQHEQTFRINSLYEKVIRISKDASKINRLAKLIEMEGFQFPTYSIDMELNRQVQSELLRRREERLAFDKERRDRLNTNSLKKIQDQSEIQEEDIKTYYATSFQIIPSGEDY